MRTDGLSAGRVLVVAASRVARSVVVSQLGPHGFELAEAPDGRVALTLGRAHRPDAVLLDAELPGEDALSVLDHFKADPDLAHVPVVLISHRTSSADVAEGLGRGAHDYLRKPVEPSELVARVMAALRLKQLQDSLRRTNAELRHTAGTDSLTGLPNRRLAADQIDRLLARARRHEIPFALALADLDDFKSVNDQHGHAVGDAALVAVARRLSQACRSGDLLARWGGDELIVLTPDSRDGAAIAERLRLAVAAEPIEARGLRLPLTLTVGWSAWQREDAADTLLIRADRALYEQKAQRR